MAADGLKTFAGLCDRGSVIKDKRRATANAHAFAKAVGKGKGWQGNFNDASNWRVADLIWNLQRWGDGACKGKTKAARRW